LKKITVDIPDEIYVKIKKNSVDETIKQKKFVGMNDLILPLLEKEFGK
jgi:hypothetical protein